jgi:hypothetical protein
MRFLLLGLCVACLPAAELTWEKVLAESNLEKRSEKSLDYAHALLTAKKKPFESGEPVDVPALIKQVRDAVDYAVKCLQDSGKNPRKSPKYYKKAELKTRELARRLDNLAKALGYEERQPVEQAFRHVERIHEDLLHAVMTKQ